MAVTDRVADLLTRIRNAKNAKHKYVDVSFSKLNHSIIEVMKENGYVTSYLVNEARHQIRVFLRYQQGALKSVIHGLKRISKPSVRYYVGYKEIPKVSSGLGIAILSTPAGILEGEKAREMKKGGELLCLVW